MKRYPVTHPRDYTLVDIDRFYSKTRYNRETECLEWTACQTHSGYGQFSMRHNLILAHRWVMQLALKRELSPDEVVRHRICDNPPCVALHHLAVGTQADNVDDMNTKGRNRNANKSACKYGHPYDEDNTYYMPNGGRDCKACVSRRGREYRERKRREGNASS